MKKCPSELVERARAAKPALLSDEQLENVAGGAGVVNDWHSCPHFVCCFCGEKKKDPQELQHFCAPNGGDVSSVCSLCQAAVWQTGAGWVCSL